MRDALDALVADISRRIGNDATTNLLSDICDECDAAQVSVLAIGNVDADPDTVKLVHRAMHHLMEIERIVDLLDQNNGEPTT